MLAAVVRSALLAADRVLRFEPRFPTTPDPGPWVNPYEATDSVTGERFGLKPRLPDVGPRRRRRVSRSCRRSVENPRKLEQR